MLLFMNKVDTIKALFTYLTASILAIGGGAALVFVSMPPDKLAIVASIVSGASVFLFGQETSTRTARQVIAAGQHNGQQAETLRHS